MVQAISSAVGANILPVRGPAAVAGQPQADPSVQPQAAPAVGKAGGPAPFTLRGDHNGEAAKALQKMLSPLIPADAHLAISQDEFISRFIYKFIDPNNGKTLRQYPQSMVVQSLHAMEQGVQRFLDEKA